VCAPQGTIELTVPLSTGTSSLSFAAIDEKHRSSNLATTEVTSTAPSQRPDLWIVSIGIDHYPKLGRDMQLLVAAADARGVATAFGGLAGPGKPYARTHTQLLVDDDATPSAIVHALDELHTMKPDDVAVVFLGGHGLKPSTTANMVFATGQIDETDPRTLKTATIGWQSIGSALERAPGRVLVLLDACHSGHLLQDDVLPNDALADDLVHAGVVVFAAAKGRQESYEPSGARGFSIKTEAPTFSIARGHGLFTGAVLESLHSATTDRNNDGRIELQELVDDVTSRVGTTTHGLQTPWVARRSIFGDFSLALAPH
jgi:uncharacterized caspase-like protein